MGKYANEVGQAYLSSIVELVARLESDKDSDAVLNEIYEYPLEVAVRSGWSASGEQLKPEEYMILLCTGGPAVRIVGDLEFGEPTSAVLEIQDWFEPWAKVYTSCKDTDALLTFAQQFYFGV